MIKLCIQYTKKEARCQGKFDSLLLFIWRCAKLLSARSNECGWMRVHLGVAKAYRQRFCPCYRTSVQQYKLSQTTSGYSRHCPRNRNYWTCDKISLVATKRLFVLGFLQPVVFCPISFFVILGSFLDDPLDLTECVLSPVKGGFRLVLIKGLLKRYRLGRERHRKIVGDFI